MEKEKRRKQCAAEVAEVAEKDKILYFLKIKLISAYSLCSAVKMCFG